MKKNKLIMKNENIILLDSLWNEVNKLYDVLHDSTGIDRDLILGMLISKGLEEKRAHCRSYIIRRCFTRRTEKKSLQTLWDKCPECNCKEYLNADYLGKGFRTCKNCSQEWWSNVQYTDEYKENRKRKLEPPPPPKIRDLKEGEQPLR